jgi:ABC-type phosphate transport system substrate-binding protein
MDRRGWLLVLLLSLTACVATPEPSTTPFSVQRIALTSEFEGLVSSWLAAYIEESGQAHLKLELFSHQEMIPSLEDGRAELGLISRDVPEGWFATPLCREPIAVIVNPSVDLASLDLNHLADIFSGREDSWDSLGASSGMIQPVVPPTGSEIRERFIQVVMGNSAFDPAALVGGTLDATVELVESNPGAIGFVPLWRVDDGVETVAIAGIEPKEETALSGAYPLWVDVLAVSPEEPVGYLRDFLGWLQGTYLPPHVR